MYRYREKIVIRIVGQPMFRAEQHHHEQARCRNCGRVVRAEGPAYVHEGVGTDYIRYDWSACAMLLVMHYSGGAPFKRIESLHEGWGVPMPDANQWELVANAADDLLLPLYRALEQHAIQKATNFRIDDTGSMVITLKRQIEAELSALEPSASRRRTCGPASTRRGLLGDAGRAGRPLLHGSPSRRRDHRSSPRAVACSRGPSL